jgi:hypothetical protein
MKRTLRSGRPIQNSGKFFLLLSTLASSHTLAAAERGQRIVEATYKITDGQTAATCFLLERPKPDGKGSQILLITAAHVLETFQGDVATLSLRRVKAPDDIELAPTPVGIRQNAQPLWIKHPEVDVAAIRIPPRDDFQPAALPLDMLATDETWKQLEFEPGDLIRMVGYPHAMQFEPNPLGYPTTRLGALAGFPLKPSAKSRMFLIDANIFEGDSGGPIYFLGDKPADGGPRPIVILGLLHGQHFINEAFRTVYQSGEMRHRFGVGIGIHAAAIRETIEKVPVE